MRVATQGGPALGRHGGLAESSSRRSALTVMDQSFIASLVPIGGGRDVP